MIKYQIKRKPVIEGKLLKLLSQPFLGSFLMLSIKALKGKYFFYSVSNVPTQALTIIAAVKWKPQVTPQKQQQLPDSSSLEVLSLTSVSPVLSFFILSHLPEEDFLQLPVLL